jgi:hypothetical protein
MIGIKLSRSGCEGSTSGSCCFALVVGLTKSSPEFRAIAWHYRHGSRVTVNGVTFPVYYWYAPTGDSKEFSVWDKPGPLRPTEDGFTAFQIKGWRDEGDVGIPQDLVQKEAYKYEKAGYQGASMFRLNIRSETLECVQEHDDRFQGWTIYCYGGGPLYSVFFTGGEDALVRFKRTIAEAK